LEASKNNKLDKVKNLLAKGANPNYNKVKLPKPPTTVFVLYFTTPQLFFNFVILQYNTNIMFDN